MTTFDRREEAFENLFAHDEEIHFLAESRRAKMIAAWAASRMGKSAAESEAYVAEILTFTVSAGGPDTLLRRISADLSAADVSVPAEELHNRMDTMLAEALHHVKTA